MVLVPAGQQAVSISVNGTERVSELISDDTSYNLSESFTTDINVNGTQEGSYTQSSNSDYNVSVSSSVNATGTQTEVKTRVATVDYAALADTGELTFHPTPSIPDGSFVSCDVMIEVVAMGSGGKITIDGDTTIYTYYDWAEGDTKIHPRDTLPDTIKVRRYDDDGGSLTLHIYVKIYADSNPTVSSSASVDGVSKQ